MKKRNNNTPYDLVFITNSRWDDVSSTVYSLAQEFSKSHRVFYMDKPFTWTDLLRGNPKIKFRKSHYLGKGTPYRTLPGLPENFVVVLTFLTLPINWLSRGRLYNFFRSYHQRKMVRCLRRLKKDYQLDRYILFNSFNPNYSLQLPDDIAPAIRIYQCVDSMKSANYLSKHGPYLEEAVAREADLMLGTSRQIVKNFEALGLRIAYLPNAANIAHFKDVYFADTEKPKAFIDGQKTIGYIGSIDFRTNYKLMRKLALANPDKNIMMIGPVRKVENNEGLDALPNVIFTGPIHMDQLPYYAKYLDCAIIPFEHNEFTRSVYPLKINEYLAAGRPVVTTRFSDDMADFEAVAFVTNDEDTFVANVAKALQENTPEKERARIAFSENNSWTNRTEQFWNIIEAYENNTHNIADS